MTSAHDIASGFEHGAMSLAGIAFTCIQDARARQVAADVEQAERNLSAAARLARAAHRQRQDLQAAVDEAAALRAQVARLQRELAASRAETTVARQQVVTQQRETVRIKRLLLGAVGLRAA